MFPLRDAAPSFSVVLKVILLPETVALLIQSTLSETVVSPFAGLFTVKSNDPEVAL